MKKIELILLVLILIAIPSFSGLGCANEKISNWTFMLFVNGDNDLDSFWAEKLDELELLDYSEQVKILCLFDRYESGANIYEMVQDDTPSTINSKVLKDLGEINVGNPDVLLDFLNFAAGNYPADYYGLIILGHGDPSKGLGPDEHLDSTVAEMAGKSRDFLTVEELKTALEKFKKETGIVLDIIGFEACLMGTFEVASALKDCAKIMIASPTFIYSETWADAHIFLSLLKDPEKSPEDFAKKVVEDSLKKRVIDHNGDWQLPHAYLTAVNLSYISEITKAFSQLNTSLINQLQSSPESMFDLERAMIGSGKFSCIFGEKDKLNLDFWTPDLLVFAELLQSSDCFETQEKAGILQKVVKKAA